MFVTVLILPLHTDGRKSQYDEGLDKKNLLVINAFFTELWFTEIRILFIFFSTPLIFDRGCLAFFIIFVLCPV